MEISTGHHQAMSNNDHQLVDHEELVVNYCPKSSPASQITHHENHHQLQQDKKVAIRPHQQQPEQALRCPRCDSTNTKFCYYNNYSFSQPRYFCKGCRRYWTKGGSLRNVPVGGGCRKNNKRSSPSTITTPNSSSTCSSSSSKKSIAMININPTSNLLNMPLPPLTYDPSHDLTLAFSSFHHDHPFLLANPNPNPNPNGAAFLDILRGGGGDHDHQINQINNDHHGLYYGFGGGGDDMIRGMLSFDAGGCSDSTRLATETGVVLPNIAVEPAAASTNVNSTTTTTTSHGRSLGSLMESAGGIRDYWNGVNVGSNSSWHGLINSSLL